MSLWPSVLRDAKRVLELDEGRRNTPYKDTKGLWTIGVGRLVGESLIQMRFSDAVIDQMLSEDIEAKWRDAERLFGEDWLSEQKPARQIAILSLLFSLGVAKLSTFTQTVPAIRKENWDLAADLLLKTKWSADVDPKRRNGEGRDDRIAEMLRTGELPSYYED